MGNAALASWYWSGDQGLFSRALMEAHTRTEVATQIVNVAIATMCDADGILHENLDFNHYPLDQFLGDYATGPSLRSRPRTGRA